MTMGTVAEDAHQYRLQQAEQLLRKFRQANGRDAATIEELSEWVKSRENG